MLLFDSNPMHPLNQLSFECQKYILALTMVQFREFPLCSGSYNEEKIRFYDGVLGNLIRTRDTTIKYNKNPKSDVLKFACNWEDRKSTRLNSSHMSESRMPSSA